MVPAAMVSSFGSTDILETLSTSTSTALDRSLLSNVSTQMDVTPGACVTSALISESTVATAQSELYHKKGIAATRSPIAFLKIGLRFNATPTPARWNSDFTSTLTAASSGSGRTGVGGLGPCPGPSPTSSSSDF